MVPVFLDEDVIEWLEPETDEEREFLDLLAPGTRPEQALKAMKEWQKTRSVIPLPVR